MGWLAKIVRQFPLSGKIIDGTYPSGGEPFIRLRQFYIQRRGGGVNARNMRIKRKLAGTFSEAMTSRISARGRGESGCPGRKKKRQ